MHVPHIFTDEHLCTVGRQAILGKKKSIVDFSQTFPHIPRNPVSWKFKSILHMGQQEIPSDPAKMLHILQLELSSPLGRRGVTPGMTEYFTFFCLYRAIYSFLYDGTILLHSGSWCLY